eukprot:Skav221019  [mRNA]  locus=scaffold2350:405305:406735:- [translate_table: standard]
MWEQMAQQLQVTMGPQSSYAPLALEKLAAEASAACMISNEKGYWSHCMRETWMPEVNICGNETGCDIHSKGSGVCSVRLDGTAYSLTHCGVFPAPALNRAQSRDVQLFCPAAVPISVFPILKCGHTALSQWLGKLEGLETQDAVSRLLQGFQEKGAPRYLKAALSGSGYYQEIGKDWIHDEVNFGGPESFFNEILRDVTLLGHDADLKAKLAWAMKFTSRLMFDHSSAIVPDSHLYLPPHLCSSCCKTARGRLPVVLVRNPFARLASNWRLTVLLPLQWHTQHNLDNTGLESVEIMEGLQSLSHLPNFVSLVEGLLAGNAALNAVDTVGRVENLMDGRVPVWPPSHPLSLGDVMHMIPITDLLNSAPTEWRSQKKFFLHLEHLEDDMQTLSKVLCSDYGFCNELPSFPHIKPTDEHKRDGWSTAEDISWRMLRSALNWTQPLVTQTARIYREDFELLGYDAQRPEEKEPSHPFGVW